MIPNSNRSGSFTVPDLGHFRRAEKAEKNVWATCHIVVPESTLAVTVVEILLSREQDTANNADEPFA